LVARYIEEPKSSYRVSTYPLLTIKVYVTFTIKMKSISVQTDKSISFQTDRFMRAKKTGDRNEDVSRVEYRSPENGGDKGTARFLR